MVCAVCACLAPFDSRAEELLKPESDKIRNIRTALQAKYAALPEVPLNTDANGVKFLTVDLKDSLTEIDGLNYFAFRFRTGVKFAPFVWSFKKPTRPTEWFIFPEKGRMEGFDTFYHAYLPQDLEGIGKKDDHFLVQVLGQNYIEKDTGYIMWFRLDKQEEPKITLSMNMIPDLKSYSFSEVFPMLYGEKK